MKISYHNRLARRLKRAAIIATMLFAGSGIASAARTDFAFKRYQVIVDRKPFGDVPLPPPVVMKPEPPKPTTPGPGSYLKKVRMCAIRETGGPGGPLKIGLVDDNMKPPRSYFLYVGDMQDGIEIKDAEYDEKRVLVKREDEEFWIDMNAGSKAPRVTAAAASGLATRKNVARSIAGKVKPRKSASYAQRLRERREEEKLKRQVIAEEKAKLTKEELRQFFREQQMEIIRNGQPALPIPLTKEMDDQLVAEGVLEPIE
jgi:hypothetical protein